MATTQPNELTKSLTKAEAEPKSKYTRNAAGQYTCTQCDKVTDRQNTMFYHLKKHAGTMDYPCTEPGCAKAFVQKSGLQQHVAQAHPNVVDKTNPYANQIYECLEQGCDHKCRMKANLQIHMARKHSPWIPTFIGTCTGCARAFASPTAYYYHAIGCQGLLDNILTETQVSETDVSEI